eukprot:TRINITY_DN6171_c0_g1_i2.p1 TRINITY_DN6171_c0_g1~~TRINITY_DN6171_c0_g1_i2.p1  ORF type:complete len:285 (-),score=87.42 TRINITY_DN6171_c0_g1_i2:76-930(-)
MMVSVEGDDDKTIEEKIQLPFQPSSYLLAFLFSISKEIHRIGSHTVDKSVMLYLLHEVSEKIVSQYTAIVNADEKKMNKEGLIQLLVDVRFAFDVVSGRKALIEGSKEHREINAAIKLFRDESIDLKQVLDGLAQPAQWNVRVNNLVQTIEDKLDPIDVAFYQSPLRDCVMKCYLRTALLFGSMVHYNTQYANSKPSKSSIQEQHNVLTLSNVVSRFSLLPVSSPPLRPLLVPAIPLSLATPQLSSPNSSAPSSPVNPGFKQTTQAKSQQQQSFVNKLGSMFGR